MAKLGDYIIDIAAGPFGSNLKVNCFVPDGFPIIDGANLKGYKVTDNVTKFVTEEKARSLHRSIAKRNDVVATISGNVGQISYIPNDSKYEEYLVSQRQFRATFDTDKVFVPYLIYYFHSREGQHKILSFANQTGVPALAQPLKNFKNIDITLPDIQTQRSIASILKSLDDKIESNRKINENLEQQAQALFKNWFIDFEPFKDGKFIDSELGLIPEGWRVGTLGDVMQISKVSINPSKQPQSIFNHFSIPAFDNGMLPEKQFGHEILSNKFKIDENMTLFSKLNPRIKRLWFVGKVPENAICSTEFVPFEANKNDWPFFIKCLVGSDFFYNNAMSLVNGATGSHQRFHPQETLLFTFPLNETVIDKFNRLVQPVILQQVHNLEECQRLSILRDTLLPKLMSGEIEV